MGWGAIYPESWWGNANESNGWGFVYPLTAGGSYLTADTIIYSADTTSIKSDATEV